MKNTIFNFDLFAIYLAGPMEFAKDQGKTWRENVTTELQKLGISNRHILDPCNKPMNNLIGQDLDVDVERLNELREKGAWDEFERLSKNTIHVDFRMVDKSDVLYAHIDTSVYTCGTFAEITLARYQRKPVLVVVPGGVKNSPAWLVGQVGYKHIFTSDAEALSYLNDVMHGVIAFDHKSWLFFDVEK